MTANSLQVLWNDGAGETAYQLAWAPAANPGAMTYVDLAGNSTDWTHVGLGPAQTYYYWLRACFFALCSEWAGHVEGTTSGLGALPDATADVALMDDAGTVAVLSKVVASRPPAPPPATAPAPGITAPPPPRGLAEPARQRPARPGLAPPAHRAPVPPVRPATARAPATLPLPAGVGAPRTTVPPAPVTIPMRPPRPASAPPPSSNRAR